MSLKTIGPSFVYELAAYGASHSVQILGTHFTWFASGSLEFFDDTPATVKAAVEAVYAAHDPTKADPLAVCQISSTSTPALNGTYAIDEKSLVRIAHEALYIQTTQAQGAAKFTNGQTAKSWDDVAGASHSFSPTQFIAFAEAVAQYVDALASALNTMSGGGGWTAPAQPVAIA